MTELIKQNEIFLTGPEVKRKFQENYFEILQRQNPGLDKIYLIDFIHKAQLTGANPALNQIYLTSYFSKKLGRKVGTTVFAYHFFLSQANQTGEFSGVKVDSAVENVFNPFTRKDEKELVSTAITKRKGKDEIVFKARWPEFFNQTNSIWRSKPYIMLEKTAIANVIRWAFPEAMSGMFIEEEIRPDEIVKDAEDFIEGHVSEAKAVEQIEKDQRIVEDAHDSDKRGDIIEAIRICSSKLTSHMDSAEKVSWMKQQLNVKEFNLLKNKSKSELKGLLSSMEAILEVGQVV